MFTEHQLQQFFKDVCVNERIHDWTLSFCSDSYCWLQSKCINVDFDYNGDLRQLILHEIAHINTCKYTNQKHTYDYWKHMEYLCYKYLRQDIDENQRRHKFFASEGFCSLIYYNGIENRYMKNFSQKFSMGKILVN